MKSVWLKFLVAASEAFQKLDLTTLALSFLKIGGVLGWFARIFLKRWIKKAEEKLDNTVDSVVDTYVSDSQIEEKKLEHIKQQAETKTDEEFDKAADDSFR